jgi:hypothetical protein
MKRTAALKKTVYACMALAVVCLQGHAQSLPAVLDSAVTRDLNGNGYLDRIELYLNKAITIPADFQTSNFTITSGNVIFSVDSIGGVLPGGKTDSIFVLYIREDSTTGSLQTAWTPRISVDLPNTGSVTAMRTIDGAGPVIWKITKTIFNINDRTQDRVTVVFSERIYDRDGLYFKVINQPGLVFSVWKRNSQGGYDSVPGVLDNILHFATVLNDSTMQFDMLNGKDLATNEYLSISSARQVTDQTHRNYPDDNNRKAPVFVMGVNAVEADLAPLKPFICFIKSNRGYLISFGGYDRGEVSATLYSASGQLFLNLRASDFGPNNIFWDYKDKSGKTVPNGLYLLEIKAGARIFKQKIMVTR